ncbi:MAG: phage tail protein, partial [Acetobacteraceae bacterium]|nr:phage tail protein [Acetobacteraceae bacterium]
TLPNFTFEVFGIESSSGANGLDANPAAIVTDLLTNPRYGANFPAANLDSLSSYAGYCAALGLFLSPLLDTQQEAQQSLADITNITNSALVWSGGLLKILPYGDQPITNAFTLATFSGAPTQTGGDTLSLTFTDPSFNGGLPYTVQYTTVANLQMPGATAGLAQAVNGDGNLAGFGVRAACADFAVLIIQSAPTGNTTIGQSGDGEIAANGIGATTTYSWMPVTTPVYSLGEDDFIVQESSVGTNLGVSPGGPVLRSGASPITGGFTDDPVHVIRSTPADANNMVEVECLDRANNYNTAIVEAFDQASIDLYGVRRDTSLKARLIADPLYVGPTIAQLVLQRSLLYRNTYTFQLGWKYCLLEPMDLIQITDARLGLAALTVRVTAVEEDDEGTLSITAEDFFGPYSSTVLYPPVGYQPAASPSIIGSAGGTAPSYNAQPSGGAVGGFVPNWSTAPGNVNPPLIFEPPTGLLSGELEIWVALSGGPNWGGAQIWASSDGSSYALVGSVDSPAGQGVTSALLASYSGTNPDTNNTASVDLTESRGQLVSVSAIDAANLMTLCYVGGELIAYQTATLTGASKYNLTTLYRGAYGSPITDHPVGAQFALLNGSIGRFSYPSTLIGQTIFLKFPSTNIVGGGLQSLAEVLAYSYTVKGTGQTSSPIVSGSYSGKPSATAVLQSYVFAAPIIIPAGFSGSQSTAATAATAAATFNIRKNGASIGAMTFSASATSATFAMSSATDFSAGDVLTIVAPAIPDATLANLAWTIMGFAQ